MKELEYAEGKWGTTFDDNNTLNDWVTYINMYASQASRIDSSDEVKRASLIKAAGIAISALVTLERNGEFPPRHYEDSVEK